MQKHSLDAVAREQLDAARRSASSRASTTVVGGHEHVLRQTLIALVAGASMAEHDNPGEATLYVVTGRVDVHANGETWQARTGDLIEFPPGRHAVDAIEDSAILLTAVPRGHLG